MTGKRGTPSQPWRLASKLTTCISWAFCMRSSRSWTRSDSSSSDSSADAAAAVVAAVAVVAAAPVVCTLADCRGTWLACGAGFVMVASGCGCVCVASACC